jgi:hypothetical protein
LDDAVNPSAITVAESASLPGVAPARITDLRALSVAESTVVLTWTATGENGAVGRPLGYVISGSPSPMDSSNVDVAPLQVGRPAFQDAGGAETTLVVALTPGRRWRFAVHALDHAQALSPISKCSGGHAGRRRSRARATWARRRVPVLPRAKSPPTASATPHTRPQLPARPRRHRSACAVLARQRAGRF